MYTSQSFRNIPLIALILMPLTVYAEESSVQENEKIHDHGHAIDEIIATASPHAKTRLDIMQGSSLLTGDALDRAMEATIGETLSHIPGISSSFFGPGASRPIIRGLGGDRIRMLINGISTADAGNTSPDHAVAVDSLTATKVEVLRGASTLIYGNNAIGGVVNVIDARIPTVMPEDGATGKARISYGSVSDDFSVGSAVTFAVHEKIALHLNGSYRTAGDYNIPGFAESAAFRAAEEAEEGPEEEEGHEEQFGTVAHSSLENYSAALGASYIGEDILFGASFSLNNSNYGVPVHAEHHEEEEHEGEEEHHEEEEGVRIKLDQKRFDLKGEINREFGLFEAVRLRFGYADYQHQEIEDGEIATTFINKEWETRAEFIQQESEYSNGIIGHGSMGIQVKKRDFSATGEEAFIPPTSTLQIGAFIVEELTIDQVTLEFGGRYDYQKNSPLSGSNAALERRFDNFTFSAGIAIHPVEDSLVGLNISRTERAPTAEELFSDGPHFATSSYEVGNRNLSQETATSIELTFKKFGKSFSTSLNLYHTWFNDFIYARETGAELDGLGVFMYEQKDARFYGAEFEMAYVIFNQDDASLDLEFSADFVNAKFVGGDYIPRIPAKSASLALSYETALWGARTDVTITDAQTNLSVHELKTDGYTDLNAEISMRPFEEDKDVTLRLQVRNILNSEMRQHSSFLKDQIPLPGRDIRLSVNYIF